MPTPPVRRGRGVTSRKGRTKTPAGTRSVGLPLSIAVFYELLLGSHNHAFVFTTPEERWAASLVALMATERSQLVEWFPHLG